MLFFLLTILSIESKIPENNNSQEFGDHMAEKNNIGSIWKPILTEWCIVFFYSLLATHFTKDSIYIIPIYYLFANIGFYFWHYYAHVSKGEVNKVHMDHHILNFNSNNFYGDKNMVSKKIYKDYTPTFFELLNPKYGTQIQNDFTVDDKDNFVFEHDGSLLLILCIILLVGKLYFHTKTLTLSLILILYIASVTFQSALHISYHVRNVNLEKYDWFRELRAVHFHHHLHNKNFSIIDMGIDVLFGSFVY